jgi:chemotaxis protein MotB
MKRTNLIYLCTLAILLSSCVVGKRKYKAEVAAHADAESRNKALLDKTAILEKDTSDYGNRYRNLESAKNYLEQTTSSEKEHLSSELNEKGKQLSSKDQLLLDREKKLQELQDIIAKKEAMVNALRTKVTDALIGFKGEDLSIQVKNGKVYVSMQENLLFKSGSAKVDPKGKEAIHKLGEVLLKNSDIDIMIEGHTDNIPLKGEHYKDNWALSADRALSIVRQLTEKEGLDAKRITAAGRSEFSPVASNDTPEGRAKNRRTEIILSPKLDELMKILDGK